MSENHVLCNMGRTSLQSDGYSDWSMKRTDHTILILMSSWSMKRVSRKSMIMSIISSMELRVSRNSDNNVCITHEKGITKP